MKNKTKDKSKVIMITIIILLIVINIFLSITLIMSSTRNKNTINCGGNDKGDITYNDVANIVNNNDSALIYYYNSNSSNNNNILIKDYLNKLGIKYYLYDDAHINKSDYDKLLKLFNIDSKIFNPPAIIYIRDGKMYGNLINIDNKETVKIFIDNYDLYTIK